MFKKKLLFLSAFFAVASLVEAPRSLDSFFDASFSQPAGDFYREDGCKDDAKSWENLAALSQKLIGLKTSRHIANADPAFAEFLTAFVTDDEVAALLARRPEIVYRDRPVGGLSPEEVAVVYGWLVAFKAVVESGKFKGQLLTPFSEKHLPTTIEIKFPEAPGVRPQGYVVKLLCRNGWRLGFYDGAGKDCNACDCKAISPFPFPLQMISCLFYEDWMHELDEKYVRVAHNYLFPLPGTERLPLDDWDVFVIEEDFRVPANQAWQIAQTSKLKKIREFPDYLRKTRGFSFKIPEDFFLRKDGTQLVVRSVQRPAFGGSPAYLFLAPEWEHSLHAHMDGGCGVSSCTKSIIELMGDEMRAGLTSFAAITEDPYSDDEGESGEGSAAARSRRSSK